MNNNYPTGTVPVNKNYPRGTLIIKLTIFRSESLYIPLSWSACLSAPIEFMSVKEAVEGALQGVLKVELQGANRERIQRANQEALQRALSRLLQVALERFLRF